jgi:hypothetical protein
VGPVQPSSRKIRQVSSRVATVMPEIGLDEEPSSPVSREETVTNMKPKSTIRTAPKMFMCSDFAIRMAPIRATTPRATHFSEMSRSVLGTSWAVAVASRLIPKSARPPCRPRQMVGSARARLIRPPAVTAPAPI